MEVSKHSATPDYASLQSSSEWLVTEDHFDQKKINFYETIFTVGNGYLGTRGSLEEGHYACLPGTYINGVFDHYDSFVVDLVNAPSWPDLSIWIDDKKLSLHNCEIIEYKRVLDFKKGMLFRTTRYKDSEGRITRFESVRYASLDQRHLFEVNGSITAENYSDKISLQSDIDGHVFNLDLMPAYKETPVFDPEMKWNKWSKSKHLKQTEAAKIDQGTYLEMKTLDRPYHIGYASSADVNVPHQKTIKIDYEKTTEILEFDANKGQPINFQKLVAIYTSRDMPHSDIKASCENLLLSCRAKNFQERFDAHTLAWEDKWDDCDIVIDGDAKVNHALRFNIYHLLITANEFDNHANIGAKSLSGEGYKGHVFWDTEIFLLPFYIFTQPKTAEALMMYRYNTMEGAREYARLDGYKGIRYAWESADTGHETTPPWTADGKVRIWTGERELHITSAIVFGTLSYLTATDNIKFLINYGAEILFETARFWQSRMEYNKAKDRFELKGIEGPDEFHELVDNSVYTNWLTKWSLVKSAEYYEYLIKNHRDEIQPLIDRLSLDAKEVSSWKNLAQKIYIPFNKEDQLIEQFEGYFGLEDIPITQWDENNMPIYPEGYHHDNCSGTKLLKQPDVIMLLYLLPDEFDEAIKKTNYEYYESRTMHKSSLSPSIHTIMGIEINNYEKALQYFERSAFVDLIDNQGNTNDGMHIASAGGTWQAVVNGFGGMRVRNRQLSFKPWLPPKWNAIHYKIKWKGDDLKVSLFQKELIFEWLSSSETDLQISVNGNKKSLQPNIKTSFNLT